MSAVSPHAAPGLYDVVLVRRPKGWRPTDTHEIPPRCEVIGVELFGVEEIIAEDLLCEINSSHWLDEWAVMLPHKADTRGPLRVAVFEPDGTLQRIVEQPDPRDETCRIFNEGISPGEPRLYAIHLDGDVMPSPRPTRQEIAKCVEGGAA
jgi:hypothetical protein